MIQYRTLHSNEITRQLFRHFIRRQEVTLCRRREAGEWVWRSDPFTDDWSEADYGVLVQCLKNTVLTGGFVYAAFVCQDNRIELLAEDPSNCHLKGFVSVESEFLGSQKQYLDLSSIHVSEDMRGQGIGKALFTSAAEWARRKGAKKLYISSHSAMETQAFYKAMGCVEAEEYNQRHTEAEPYDCQLEYKL